MLSFLRRDPKLISASAAVWSRDGSKFAIATSAQPADALGMQLGSPFQDKIEVFAQDGTQIREIKYEGKFLRNGKNLVFSKDGETLIGPGDAKIRPNSIVFYGIYDGGEAVLGLSGKYPRITAQVSVSYRANFLFVNNATNYAGSIEVYSLVNRKKFGDIALDVGQPKSLASPLVVSHDEKFFAISTRSSIFIYSTETLKLEKRIQLDQEIGFVREMTFSSDDAEVAVSSGYFNNIEIINVDDGRVVNSLQLPGFPRISGLSWPKSSRDIAFVSDYKRIEIWHPECTGVVDPIVDGIGEIYDMSFSPNGTVLAASTDRGLAFYSYNP